MTIPVVDVTDAMADELVVHIPGVGVDPNVIVVPTHTLDGPVIGVGSGFTVNTLVAKHVPGVVYVIVTVLAVNTLPPVATPVLGSIVAMAVLLLVQVPPASVLLNVIVDPAQTTADAAVIVIAGVVG